MEQVCRHCGALVGADDHYCARCGAALQAAPEATPVRTARPPRQQPADPPPPARRSPWWTVLWTLLPLAAVVAILIMTNPSRHAYARWLADQVTSARPALAARLSAGAAPTSLARATIAQNELIFTIFDTRVHGFRVDVLGIFDHFVPLGPSPID